LRRPSGLVGGRDRIGGFWNLEFRAAEGRDSELFSLEVDLSLFLLHRVPVQDGPRFCLQLLEAALIGDPGLVGRFRNYAVRSEDFQVLLLERARKLAKNIHKPPRSPFRKPSGGSNLFLGVRSPKGMQPQAKIEKAPGRCFY